MTNPMLPRIARWVAVLPLLAGAGLASLAAGAESAPPRPERAALVHPRPLFCGAEREYSQKDLRVLRLIYGIARGPGQRLRLPWFYDRQTGPEGGVELRLRAAALWGGSQRVEDSAPPAAVAAPAEPALGQWHRQMLAALPGLLPLAGQAADPFQGEAATKFQVPAALAGPLLWSRFSGSRLLPRLDAAVPGCPAWPAGVRMRTFADARAYSLSRPAGDAGGALTLTGYRSRAVLWRAYRRGKVRVLLLDGAEVLWFREQAGAGRGGAWGVETGTQRLALRLAPEFAGVLGAAGRQALSMAVRREMLAPLAGSGSFVPARSFLVPVRAPRAAAVAPALRWDSGAARRLWLQTTRPGGRLRLAVVAHPALRAVAGRLVNQWQRTLNLQVNVVPLPGAAFAASIGDPAYALHLDVLDLDDGSLQALWALWVQPHNADPAAWEAWFRKEVPYLPLLQNRHFVVARNPGGAGHIAAVCPGCTVFRPGEGSFFPRQ